MSSTRVGNVVLTGLVLCTLATFWILFSRSSSLETAFARALNEHAPPHLLNGLRLTPEGLEPLGAPSRQQTPQANRTHKLFIVFSDTCAACERQAIHLSEFIARSALRNVSLTFVTVDEQSLLSRFSAVARTRDVTFESFRIIDRDAFIYSTGVLATPKLVVLDASSRVRFVTSGFAAGDLHDVEAFLAKSEGTLAVSSGQ